MSGAHDVTVASNACEGMNLLKQMEDVHLDKAPLDMIISCVHIDASQDMTVFDLLKWTKGNPQIQLVPFILICSEPTSMARSLIDSVRLAGHALGATAYIIMEDFDSSAFLAQIEYYLPEELRSLNCTNQDLEKAAMDAAPDGDPSNGHSHVSEAQAKDIRNAIIDEKSRATNN